MEVLTPDGTPATSSLATAEKQHHPERVQRRRMQLNQLLKGMQEEWLKDSGEDPLGATKPNTMAIDRHYDERWREQARVAQSAQEAVDCDPEAMANWMAAQREAKAKMERWGTPLHELHDLEEFQFRLVGRADGGDLWLSSHCAICVAENGLVRVYVTDHDNQVLDYRWDGALTGLHNDPRFVCVVHAVDYRPQELFALLGAMRVDKITFPTEEQVERARQPL